MFFQSLRFVKAAKPSAFSWRKKKEPKEHPPLTNLTSSSSVATRDSLSKLSSPLAAPSVPPILGSLIDYEGKPSSSKFWYVSQAFALKGET